MEEDLVLLFATTLYASEQELDEALVAAVAETAAKAGIEPPEFWLEDVQAADVATLWDGTRFLSGIARFPEQDGTPAGMAAYDAFKSVRDSAPGGIRLFDFLDRAEWD